ncbi:MAG: zinc-ribbon domain-containing protein [Deltaproteobacteria bacterium]|nr:zinc-ribbon domain-containing protein [Deltaproteobacteria bacterium]
MIVSCESCKSSYKLDNKKITGRGVKITCPKCKHVFVVLAPSPPSPEVVRPGMVPQKADSDWEDDEPTRVGRELAAAGNSALGEEETPTGTAVGRAAAGAVSRDTFEVQRRQPTEAPAAPQPPALSKEDVQARASTLDFRKVGVTAWKVKVRIGLVYDFSDTRTLRKYIADGRVTAADVISHDGKAWKPIGEIPDLDAFFVETYDRLAVEQAARGEPPRETPSLADLGNVAAELAAAAAAEEARKSVAPTGPSYQDPFEQLKQKQRQRIQQKRSPRDEGKGSGSRLWPGVAAVLVLGAGGLWYLGSRGGDSGGESTTVYTDRSASSGSGVKVGKAATEGAPGKTPQQIREEIEKGATRVEPEVAPPESVSRVECPAGWMELANGTCAQPSSGAPRAASSGGVNVSPPSTSKASPTASASALGSTSSVTDDEAVGDDASRNGDYDTAVTAYTKALGKKGESGGLLAKLGEAQLRVGDSAGAQGTLNKAVQQGNPRAHKLLARMAADTGDTAGAKSHYEAYLRAYPNDRDAKQGLAALGG